MLFEKFKKSMTTNNYGIGFNLSFKVIPKTEFKHMIQTTHYNQRLRAKDPGKKRKQTRRQLEKRRSQRLN